MLIRALQAKLTGRVFEEVEGDDRMDRSAIFILDVVWEVAPGGQHAVQGLIKYVREAGVSSTAEEALKML
eukprot:12930395-Prorocentrum_lima.AAC.1